MEDRQEIKYWKYLIGLFFIYYLIYYIPYLFDGLAIRGDDFSWGWGNARLSFSTKGEVWGPGDGVLGAAREGNTFNPTDFWLQLFPGVFASNTLFMFMYSLLFWASYLFFRSWDMNRIPAIIAAIFITFSPIFHTFIRTGHIEKIILSPFIMFAFAFITMMFRREYFKKSYAFLAAFFLSLSFSDGDPQVFLYFTPFFSLYALGLFFVKHPTSTDLGGKDHSENFLNRCRKNFISNRKLIPLFVIVPVMATSMTLYSLDIYFNRLTSTTGSKENVKNGIPLRDAPETPTLTGSPAQPSSKQNEQADLQNWLWATQWSLPKLETIDIFVPGFMGYLSPSPTEPYWGRIGQTEGWDQHRQGYQNYSLTIGYLGVLFIIFMIYGLIYCHPSIRVIGAALLILFLFLSYGKFSFVFKWLYSLPYMENFRNPNRFLQLFHFIAAIVFGFGLAHYYQRVKDRLLSKASHPFKFFSNFLIVIIAIGVIGFIGLFSNENDLLNYFVNRFSYQKATLIISNMYFYWIKAILVFSIACLLFHYATQKINSSNYKSWVSVILLFGLLDIYIVNKKFYWYEDPQQREKQETPFHKILRGEVPGYEKYNSGDPQDPRRMLFFKKNGQVTGQYYRYLFLDRTLPLQIVDFPLLRSYREIPKRIRNFIEMFNNPDLRFIRLPGVRYYFSNLPINTPLLKPIYMDEIKNLNERVYLYEVPSALPFFYIRGEFEMGTNLTTTLGRMNEDSFNIDQTVMFYKDVKNILTEEQLRSISPHPANKIKIKEKVNDSHYIVEADLETPTILVMNNPYNLSWVAESDGKTIPHFPVNYLFNGYYLTPEDKEIEVSFKSIKTKKNIFSFIALFRHLVFAGVIIFMLRNRVPTKPKHNKHKHK